MGGDTYKQDNAYLLNLGERIAVS